MFFFVDKPKSFCNYERQKRETFPALASTLWALPATFASIKLDRKAFFTLALSTSTATTT